jgi:anaerobic selenocysteine-containing dehydrogenase
VPLAKVRESDDVYIESPAAYGWVTPRLPLGKWNLTPQSLVDQLATIETPAPLVVTPRRPVRRMNAQHYREGDQPEALLHPQDAAAAGVIDGEIVEVTSSVGSLHLPAHVTTAIGAGAVSIQHGWENCNVNLLIDAHDLDPLTGMAHLSGTPVTVRPLTESSPT